MPSLGQQLRDQRVRREISLEQVSESTRISRTYLAALERDAFDELPGDVFAKGYVRAYADFIGADAEGLVEAFVAERRASGAPASGPAGGREYLEALRASGGDGASRSRAGYRVAIVSTVAVLVIVALGYAGWRSRTATTDPARQAPTPARSTTDSPAAPLSRTVDPPADSEEPAGSRAPEPTPAVRAGAVDDAAASEMSPATRKPPTDATRVEPAAAPRDVTETEAPAAGRLTIPEAGVGTAIVDRRLEGRADRFPAGSRVHFWTRVVGAARGERIRHIWIHEGRAVESIPLEIGGAHWRTYSRKTLYSPGAWAVEARDASGMLLAREEFTCEKAASP